MGIKKLIAILAVLSFSFSAVAQDDMGGEKKPFSIYGDFATSLQFYDNETNGAANHDDFGVNLIEINLEKNWSKSKLHLSIGYGTTAQGVNGPNATSLTTLNVMNAYYKMMSDYGLNFWVGKFESPIGHETYNQMDNSQYTRSYGFGLAPFFSTGLGVEYGADMWKVGLIASNGSGKDTDTADENKTLGLVVDLDPMENFHIDVNYLTGREDLDGVADATGVATNGTALISLIDISASYMINEMLDVAVNYIDRTADYNDNDLKANSIAGYVNANFGMFGLGLRYEQFSFDSTALYPYSRPNTSFGSVVIPGAATENAISSITLTGKAEIDQNAAVVLEYRMDSADENATFTDADGNGSDTNNVLTAGLMYRF